MHVRNPVGRLTYLGFVAAVVRLALIHDADPTRIGAIGILAAMAIVAGEVEEIRVASLLTITFGGHRRSREEGNGRPERDR